MDIQYVKGAVIKQQYKISTTSLQSWANEGRIRTTRTPGGFRLYAYQDVQKLFNEKENKSTKAKVIYARVSNDSQKDDLTKQINILLSVYPGAEVIADVGTNTCLQRSGFNSLLDRISRREIAEIIVMHKSRLWSEIGYNLFERFCESNGTQIMVHKQSDYDYDGFTKELPEEFISIAGIFADKYRSI